MDWELETALLQSGGGGGEGGFSQGATQTQTPTLHAHPRSKTLFSILCPLVQIPVKILLLLRISFVYHRIAFQISGVCKGQFEFQSLKSSGTVLNFYRKQDFKC